MDDFKKILISLKNAESQYNDFPEEAKTDFGNKRKSKLKATRIARTRFKRNTNEIIEIENNEVLYDLQL